MIQSFISYNRRRIVVGWLVLALAVSGFGYAAAGPILPGMAHSVSGLDALPPLLHINAVSAGDSFTCALTTGGGVRCWGANGNGQLGNGTTENSTTPVDVIGLASGVKAISTGQAHACALTTGGGVQCWGNNGSGELGDGTTTDQHTPVNVSGLTKGVKAIAAGSDHTCALTTAGGVKCWGNNGNGGLGDGTYTDRLKPVNVSGLASGISAITAGDEQTCALTTAGGMKCWGYNDLGELGDGTTTDRPKPVDVSGLASGVIAISAGYDHTCALTTGGVKCWGANDYGQLGDGTTTEADTPVDVSGLASDINAISAGTEHTCALNTGGGVQCWGFNDSGQVGNGTTDEADTPVDVSGLASGVSAISAGGIHTCALTDGGGVKCWGSNDLGQLGDGTPVWRTAPVDVSGLTSGISAIAAGWMFTCALTTGGGVQCWGDNSYGQLGNDTTDTSNTPVDVSGLSSGVSAISGGEEHTCALTTGGGVKCWGYNASGELGDGTTTERLTPVDVSGLTSGVSAVAVGALHTCALTTGGGIKCWGANYMGQLGDNSTTQRTTPVDVYGLTSGVSAVSSGNDFTCALTTGGEVKCWGANIDGQLGNGQYSQNPTPVPVNVSGLASGVAAIAAGGQQACALTSGGGVKCWGANGSGQLGDDTTTYRNTPVKRKRPGKWCQRHHEWLGSRVCTGFRRSQMLGQ